MLNLNEISLQMLSSIERLDYRTLRRCRRNGLLNLEHIFQYYLNNGDFRLLKLASEHINEKLIAICEKYNNCSLNFDCDIENKVDLEIEDIPDENSNHTLSNIENITEKGNITSELAEAIPNYSLYDLAQIEGLSVRTIKICVNYELTDLRKILNFYFIEKENFRHLRNCGKNSEEELVKLCEKYKESVINSSNIYTIGNNTEITTDADYGDCFPPDILETTLSELIKNENLSARSQNVCSDNEMTDLPSIITYYWANGNFLKLKNCGQKSNLELIELCRKYEIRIKKTAKVVLNDKPLNPLILKIDSLTVKQKQIINNLLVSKFNELPVRPQNALNALLDNEITLNNFVDTIFSDPEFNIYTIKNIGALSVIQINTFFEVIKEQIELVSTCQDEREIEIKLCETFLIKNFSIIDTTILTTIGDYDFVNGLPIFKIIKVLVDNDILFEIREKQIFNNEFYTLHENDFKTLNELSLELGVTRERVRQVRVQFLEKFDSKFRFILQHEIKSLINYNLDLSPFLIDISDDMIDRINDLEKVQFNRLFIIRILVIIYANKFELVGSFSQNIREKDYSTDKWKKSYLIDKRITALFDFEKFYDDIKRRLSDRIEEDYSFYFQTYLLSFITTSKYEMLDNIVEIAEYILFNEFELSLDTDDSIIFKKNTKKQVIKYVYEVLEESNKPLTVYEIYDLIEKNHPGVTKSAEAVRGSCQGDSKLIFFGRSSTYGFKVWEDELNIKGGTIREIAEEFLQNQTEPKHIDEITEYVNRYRNTNSKSVYSNLKVDEKKRFVFYCGQLIGLSSKVYSIEKYIETNDLNVDRKTWEENFLHLQKFAEENNRLPCLTGVNPEDKLYRFMNIQLRKASKGQIDDQKKSKINVLVSKYEYKKGARQLSEKWNNRYSALKEFVMTNNRLPKVGFEDEKLLYYFLSNQRRLYTEDSLPLIFKERLLEIAKLLN